MYIIDESNINKKIIDKILSLSKEAGDSKRNYPETINATAGMFFDDEGNFKEFDTVKKTMQSLSCYDSMTYMSTKGSALYLDSAFKWCLGKSYESLSKVLYFAGITTPGGSGAIAECFSNYLKAGETVLLPNLMWTPYIQFALERKEKYETYQLIKDGHFDMEDFKAKCNKMVKEQNKVVVILNDPCHNPTGFCMTDEEFKEVYEFANEIGKTTPFVLLLDLSYIDYSSNYGDTVRERFAQFISLSKYAMILIAFSGSKTFALYGLRIGALLCLTSSKEEKELFDNATEYTARATWSNCSHIGLSVLEKILSSEELKKEFKDELHLTNEKLHERASYFLEECDELGIEYEKYVSGFFILVHCDKYQEVFEKLKEKKVYVCPIGTSLRIALSSISCDEAKRLPHLIKEAIDETK